MEESARNTNDQVEEWKAAKRDGAEIQKMYENREVDEDKMKKCLADVEEIRNKRVIGGVINDDSDSGVYESSEGEDYSDEDDDDDD